MQTKEARITALYTITLIASLIALQALPVDRAYGLRDILFFAVMIFMSRQFESEMADITISQIDIIAVLSIFILDPAVAVLIVTVMSLSPEASKGLTIRWKIEWINHLIYGLATAAAAFLIALVQQYDALAVPSLGAFLTLLGGIGIFYVVNLLAVGMAVSAVKSVTFADFVRENGLGLPLFNLLVVPLGYLILLNFERPLLGDWGGWSLVLLALPIWYAQSVIISRTYQLRLTTNKLEESREQYAGLLDRLPLGAYRTRDDGTILSANQALADMLGVESVDALLQMKASDFYDNPMHRDIERRQWSGNDNEIQSTEFRLKTHDGRIIWVRDVGRVRYRPDKTVDYVDGTLEDITATKLMERERETFNERIRRAKQEWESTVDSLPNFVCLLDREKRVIRGNRKIEEWGIDTVQGINGRLITDVLKDFACKKPLVEFFDRTWERLNDGNLHFIEATHVSTGQMVIVSVYPLVLDTYRYETPRDSHAVLVLQDTTGKKQLEQELRTLNSQLEARVVERTAQLEAVNLQLQREINEKELLALDLQEALAHEKELNAFKSRFGTLISHEFRTPLTIIQNSADLMERFGNRIDVDKRAEYTIRIRRQVKHLVKLLDDILTISRADTVGLEVNPAPVILSSFADTISQEMEQLAQPHNTFDFVFDSSICATAFIDEKMVRQLIFNLVSNSVKYSTEGSPIQLSLGCVGDNLVIQVIDEGIGIPEEAQPHLFDAFYRAENVGMISGTGLGLAIVKLVADLHDGEVILSSEPNEGTTFTVRLPLKQETPTSTP